MKELEEHAIAVHNFTEEESKILRKAGEEENPPSDPGAPTEKPARHDFILAYAYPTHARG